jgi:hypothetical protein
MEWYCKKFDCKEFCVSVIVLEAPNKSRNRSGSLGEKPSQPLLSEIEAPDKSRDRSNSLGEKLSQPLLSEAPICKKCGEDLIRRGMVPKSKPGASRQVRISEKIAAAFPYVDNYRVLVRTPEEGEQYYEEEVEKTEFESLFSQGGLHALNAGAMDDRVQQRQSFFKALARRIPEIEAKSNWVDPIPLREFLGTRGLVDLYKEAISEENKSRAYRRAVVLRGVKVFGGYEWRPQQHIIVAGPSGSGKSYAAQRVIEELLEAGYGGEEVEGKETRFMSVDGGDAREVSQVRKMVIQCAVALGYRGISDLHEQTSLKVKGLIKNAAIASPDEVHIIEPLTFADPREGWSFTPGENTIFCTVVTPKTDVRKLGESRAWYNPKKPIPGPSWIQINNPSPGCESKAYSDHYNSGRDSSQKQLEKFHKETKRRLSVTVTNYFVFDEEKGVVDKENSRAEVAGRRET